MQELPPIPDKEFFSIGEVSQISQTPSYVLRYWESEFKFFRPARRNSGQRKYVKSDIETIFRLKDLLYEKKFTIEGARKHILSDRKKKGTEQTAQLNMDLQKDNKEFSNLKNVLIEAKKELEDILQILR